MVTVLVCGAGGKMGQEVLRAVQRDDELELVGAVDISLDGVAVGELIGDPECTVTIRQDLAAALEDARPDVVVDFTSPKVVYANACTALAHGAHLVIGTTGLTAEQRADLHERALANRRGILVAPNFSLGAVLMMQLSETVAKYMPHAEIIELHHNQKYDAPSGTARLTAERIAAARGDARVEDRTQESIPGARGGRVDDIPVHSVRLPGYVAHQEVLFGSLGETLTIRHDSLDRISFMPGVVLACKRIPQETGLVYGLEHFL